MLSQGIELNAMEEVPEDPYIQSRQSVRQITSSTLPVDDKLRRFLEFDGKVLRYGKLISNFKKYALILLLLTLCYNMSD